MFELKPSLEEGEVYIETFVNKIIHSSQSVLSLSKGHLFNIEKYKEPIEVIDTQSIFILTRAILEAFLSLEYLYLNDLIREEKLFRFKLWRVSGIMSRQQYADSMPKIFKEKLKKEKNLIKIIKKDIKLSPYYATLSSQHLWKLDKFGLPRLNSWGQLLSDSSLKNKAFEKIYTLYTNYAHSEYLSIIQLNEGSLHKDDSHNLISLETVLNTVCMINCSLTKLLLARFPEVYLQYEELGEDKKSLVDYWSALAMISHQP